MGRTVVIVDRSKTMRKILSDMVLANLNDVTALGATDESEVSALLAQHDCHLVVYNWDMASTDFISLAARLKSHPGGGIPLLFLFSSGNMQNLDEAVAKGIPRESMVPLQVEELIDGINRLCNPLTMRRSKRYSIAGANAKIFQADHCFYASLINVSIGGMLCDLEYSPDYRWALPTDIAINFQKDGKTVEAERVASTVSRLHVSESNPDHSPALLRVAFRFIAVPEGARQVLTEVFQQADKEESLVLQG